MEVKKRLYLELSSVVRSIIREHKEDFDKPTNDLTNRLCCVLEAVFINGLKEKFIVRKIEEMYPEPNFWPCVSKFLHRNVKAQISNLNQIKNDIGRSKAWIRLALVDGVMENYLSLIAKDQKLLKFYYHANAFIRDVELVEVMCHYLRSLSRYRLKLALNSSLLNVWTPSPLRFAGYIDDKIIGFSSTASSDCSNALPFDDEADVIVGVSALEFEGLRDDRLSCSLSSDAVSEDFSTTASTSHVIGESVEEILYEQVIGSFSKEPVFPFGTTSFRINVPPYGNRTADEKFKDSAAQDFAKKTAALGVINANCGNDSFFPQPLENPRKLSEKSPTDASNLVFSASPSSFVVSHSEEPETVFPEISTMEPSDTSELFYSFAADNDVSRSSTDLPAGAGSNELPSNVEPLHNRHDDSVDIGNSLFNHSWNDFCGLASDGSDDITYITAVDVEFTKNPVSLAASEEVTLSVRVHKFCDILKTNQSDFFPNNQDYNNRRSFLEIYLATPHETGLDSDENVCHGCSKPIGFAFGFYRTCHYDGHYYCSDCHSNDKCLIPSAVVNSWDMKPRAGTVRTLTAYRFGLHITSVKLTFALVCRRCRFFLDDYMDQPLIDLNRENPKLCLVINCLAEVHKLRQQLNYVSLYMNSCRQFVGEDFRKRFCLKEYLYTDVNLYSVMDLVQASTGQLQKHLSLILEAAFKHVFSCRLCFQKGFVCELCISSEVIFPFQLDTTHQCPKCFCVLHKSCIDGQSCPKCARHEKYLKRSEHLSISFDSMQAGQLHKTFSLEANQLNHHTKLHMVLVSSNLHLKCIKQLKPKITVSF
ncbi:unnamed protein product [Soboliphyme baturini]|uniref:RUN domain-containing protein n=1 Tax=Soboliphyme baturini TaxID=241478 RepID=A0A183IBW5_9BILA|nr:unnamed protein product [Soboliphyme baturini]